ncbi:SDR family oxidoreductase [Aureimonas psammosilenae]|uniref:SDR family oxidoreductase n=1 Tax=Aureimonas psammosilenae TaxID=2495496 RepID=UPI0012605396|nr:SDR family oxidoreductase [Aureimonas psammosilenae]
MRISGNTILVTGGNSGIGRAFAEEFHRRGNKVIVSGRNKETLDEVAKATPGIEAIRLDIADGASISTFAKDLLQRFPELDTVVHMAGIMQNEKFGAGSTLEAAEATIATNLLGPIRLSDALLPHLLSRPRAAILTVTSGLAYLPLAMTPTYCATKAAIHSWTESLRYQLRDRPVDVIEIVPPYVRTGLMGERQAQDPNAMPLEAYVAETFQILEKEPDAKEILVEAVKPLRFAQANGDYDAFFLKRNEAMMAARRAEWDKIG